ncbi:hypothetical protein Taro_053800 [Colocasia esculenta]|uniref:Uncharacterized protein n=1 Tax=Colocasia esculenta TaxID=4460 RepID=A0A843XNM3_COLES|nr:hypothetical protein [Colocasia esculenta]
MLPVSFAAATPSHAHHLVTSPTLGCCPPDHPTLGCCPPDHSIAVEEEEGGDGGEDDDDPCRSASSATPPPPPLRGGPPRSFLLFPRIRRSLQESDEELFTVPDLEAPPPSSKATSGSAIQQSSSGIVGARDGPAKLRKGRNAQDREYRKLKRFFHIPI